MRPGRNDCRSVWQNKWLSVRFDCDLTGFGVVGEEEILPGRLAITGIVGGRTIYRCFVGSSPYPSPITLAF